MPERTEPGDSTYDALHAKWVSEGRSWQFEEAGSFGYRRWRTHVTDDADNPIFLLVAAAGPTSTGYDEDSETFVKSEYWPGPRNGSTKELKDSGLEIRTGPKGELQTKMVPQPRDTTI